MNPVVRITRVKPRPHRLDDAYRSAEGYLLGDPTVPPRQRRLRTYCKKVSTLDEAAFWVESKGWYVMMGDTSQSLLMSPPAHVRIVRAGDRPVGPRPDED